MDSLVDSPIRSVHSHLVFDRLRVFQVDIYKPLGCRWVDEKVPGGLGVMLDDVLAGIYAIIIVAISKDL